MSSPVFLVESKGRGTPTVGTSTVARLRSESDVRNALGRSQRRAYWIVSDPSVFRFLTEYRWNWDTCDQYLVLLRPVEEPRRRLLDAVFRRVLTAGKGVRLLPKDELIEALASRNREDLFVGGVVDQEAKVVILYRGNLTPLIVPFDWFLTRRRSVDFDMSAFKVRDFGHTVSFGEYEVAADAIFYEFDEEYRRRAKKRQLAEDPSFGAALRRLRLQKGVGRDGFLGITAKEIARIERGEVKRPRRRTLEILGKRLGVPSEKIETF